MYFTVRYNNKVYKNHQYKEGMIFRHLNTRINIYEGERQRERKNVHSMVIRYHDKYFRGTEIRKYLMNLQRFFLVIFADLQCFVYVFVYVCSFNGVPITIILLIV